MNNVSIPYRYGITSINLPLAMLMYIFRRYLYPKTLLISNLIFSDFSVKSSFF